MSYPLAPSRIRRSRISWLVVVLGLALVPACENAPNPGRPCTTSRDCPSGRACIDGVCMTSGTDAGRVDGSPDDDGGGSDLDGGGVDLDAPFFGFDVPFTGDAGLIDPGAPDEDMDGISDLHEGAEFSTDTDMDGVPDYRDVDSDGDGISDSVEGGDAMVATPPVDTDGDGFADFRDPDSDGNGTPDTREGEDDVDGDGRLNFRDLDNDGDGLLDREEAGVDVRNPADTDGDGIHDMNEIDSDADSISDTEEDVYDTDGDTRLDRTDDDSDADGWTDVEEAGDAILTTPAVDGDGDGISDYRDPDSDNDGLSDAAERTAGTSRTNDDSDGDGVSDLIEVGAGTRPLDPTDNPRTRGNFVFLEPYMMPPSPTRDTLQFSTTLQRADVYFLMDNTGSMGGTIAALQSGLTGTVIPSIRSMIPEAWFGVGGFDDYPLGGYGQAGYSTDSLGIVHDLAFFQYSVMTPTDSIAAAAVNRYRTNYGVDGPESGVAALYALASRDALSGYARYANGTTVTTTPPTCTGGGRGAACFRADAVPIVIMMTDVNQHNDPTCGCPYSGVPGAPSWAMTTASLGTLNARVVGIATSAGANAFLTQLIQDTTIARGAPGLASEYIVSAPGGSGLTGAIATLVQRAARVPLDVSARAVDLMDPGESVNAVTAFIDHLETRTTPAAGLTCTTGFVTVDGMGIDTDSFADTFNDVTPGSPVCFDIIPRMNTTVMPTLVPQLYRAQINVIGDFFTPLDSRIVYFLVPPRIPDPGS